RERDGAGEPPNRYRLSVIGCRLLRSGSDRAPAEQPITGNRQPLTPARCCSNVTQERSSWLFALSSQGNAASSSFPLRARSQERRAHFRPCPNLAPSSFFPRSPSP